MAKAHRMLTLRERLEIIDRNESGESVKSLVTAFGVGKTQIYDLLRRKEELKKFAEATPLDKKRMGRQERDLNEKLIMEVQKRPHLYDMNHEDYRDRFIIDSEWKAVAQTVDLPVKIVRRKWSNLKSQFFKSLTTMQSTGSETRFCFHDQMSFLENYIADVSFCSTDEIMEEEETDRKDIIQLQALQDSDSANPSILPVTDNPNLVPVTFPSVATPQTPFSRKRRLNSPSTEQDSNNYIVTRCDPESLDPTLEFLKGLVPEVNQLSRKRRRNFFKGVTSLLFGLLDEQDEEAEETPQVAVE